MGYTIFRDGEENEGDAKEHPDVDGLNVGNFGHVLLRVEKVDLIQNVKIFAHSKHWSWFMYCVSAMMARKVVIATKYLNGYFGTL